MGKRLKPVLLDEWKRESPEPAAKPETKSQPLRLEPGEMLLTRFQVARKLGVTERSVFALEQKGHIPPPIKFGGRWVRHRLSDIEAWIEAGCPAEAAPQE